jgi:hypothetical protein
MGIKDTMRGGSGGTHAATGRQDFPHPQVAMAGGGKGPPDDPNDPNKAPASHNNPPLDQPRWDSNALNDKPERNNKDPEPEVDLNALRKSVKDGNAPMVKHNQDEAALKREAKENPSQGPSMDDIRNAIKGQ